MGQTHGHPIRSRYLYYSTMLADNWQTCLFLSFQLDDDLQTFLWGGTRIMAQLTTTGKLQTSRVSRKAALNTSHSCQCINFLTIRIVTKNIVRKKIIHSLTLSLMTHTKKNLWPFFWSPFLSKNKLTNWKPRDVFRIALCITCNV